MPLSWDAFIKWFGDHLSPTYSSVLLIVSTITLLCGDAILRHFGLPPMPPQYKMWARGGILLFGTTFLVLVLRCIGRWISRQWESYKHKKAIKKHLYQLPVDQMLVLIQYVQSGKSSLVFLPSDGAVCALEHRGILYRSSNVGYSRVGFAYNVTPVAAEFLRRSEFQKILLAQRPE
jgi:superinfection exclusion protein B